MQVGNPYTSHYTQFPDLSFLPDFSQKNPAEVHAFFLAFLKAKVEVLSRDWEECRQDRAKVQLFEEATRPLVDKRVTNTLRHRISLSLENFSQELREELEWIELYLVPAKYSQLQNQSRSSPLSDFFTTDQKYNKDFGDSVPNRVHNLFLALLKTWKQQLDKDLRDCKHDIRKMKMLAERIDPLLKERSTNILREKVLNYFNTIPNDLREEIDEIEKYLFDIKSDPCNLPAELLTPRSQKGEQYSPTTKSATSTVHARLRAELIAERFSQYIPKNYAHKDSPHFWSQALFYELVRLKSPEDIKAALSQLNDFQIEALFVQFITPKNGRYIPQLFTALSKMPSHVLLAVFRILRTNKGWFEHLQEQILKPYAAEFLPHLQSIIKTLRTFAAQNEVFIAEQINLLGSTPSNPVSVISEHLTGIMTTRNDLTNTIIAIDNFELLLKGHPLFKASLEEIGSIKKDFTILEGHLAATIFKYLSTMPCNILSSVLNILGTNKGWFEHLQDKILKPYAKEFLPHLHSIIKTLKTFGAESAIFIGEQINVLESENLELIQTPSKPSSPTKLNLPPSSFVTPTSSPISSPTSSPTSSPNSSSPLSVKSITATPPPVIVISEYLAGIMNARTDLANSIRALDNLEYLLKGHPFFKVSLEEIEGIKRNFTSLETRLVNANLRLKLAEPIFFGYEDAEDYDCFVEAFGNWGLNRVEDFVEIGIITKNEVPSKNEERPNEPVPGYQFIVKQNFIKIGLKWVADLKFHGIISLAQLKSYISFQILKKWGLSKPEDYVRIGLFKASDIPQDTAGRVPHYMVLEKLHVYGITSVDDLAKQRIRSKDDLKAHLDKNKSPTKR